MNTELQQTAASTAGDESPHEGNSSDIRRRPRLHLSVEHAAIAESLSNEELDLVLMVGRGFPCRQIADCLSISSAAAGMRLARLMRKVRMSHLQLAVMGYALSGQVDIVTERPAA